MHVRAVCLLCVLVGDGWLREGFINEAEQGARLDEIIVAFAVIVTRGITGYAQRWLRNCGILNPAHSSCSARSMRQECASGLEKAHPAVLVIMVYWAAPSIYRERFVVVPSR